MNARLILSLVLATACMLSQTSCGSSAEGGSADVDIEVTSGGLILPVDQATCLDKFNATGDKSATKNSINWSAFRLNWIPANRFLYVALLKLTIRSSRIAGGSQEIVLGGEDIEAMLGAPGQIISPMNEGETVKTATGNKVIATNRLTNRNGRPICAFNVGGITLEDETNTSTFSASVTIELTGTSSGTDDHPDDGLNPQLVRESYTTSVTYPQ